MNLNKYQSLIEKVGLKNLNDDERESYNIVEYGSRNFSDPSNWNNMLTDQDIKDIYEAHVKALERMAGKEIEKTKPVQSKPKVQREKKPKAKKEPKKVVKTADKPRPQKKVKAIKKRVVKKQVAKAEPAPQYLVTVKRFSKELQIIKRFLNLDGKQRSMKAMLSFHRSIDFTLKQHPDRQSVLREIYKRLTDFLHTAKSHKLTGVIVNIDTSFKDKLVTNIKSARPKLKIEYLAGVSGKSKKKAR